jgi:hypothetical protein
MKRTLIIEDKSKFEFEIIENKDERTWYFVHWNNDEKDEEGNFTIYTYQKTFDERIPIFKSNDWTLICKVGNLMNGLFHNYFNISDKYPINLK